MEHTFKTRNDGEIEIDLEKMEAYFKASDLIAGLVQDGRDKGRWLFQHPLWLSEFRVSWEGPVKAIEKLGWRRCDCIVC